MHLTLADGTVEVLHIVETEVLQIVIAGVHLLDHPLQSLSGLLRVGDDRREQMRDSGICCQFHALRVNEDEANLFRCGARNNRDEHRVDEA